MRDSDNPDCTKELCCHFDNDNDFSFIQFVAATGRKETSIFCSKLTLRASDLKDFFVAPILMNLEFACVRR